MTHSKCGSEGEEVGEGFIEEFGISRCKLVHLSG